MKRSTLILTLTAWALRWGYAMFHAQPLLPGGDSESYVHAAEQILRTGNLLTGRPIVYPLFLSLFYIGPGRMLWLALLVQSLVGALCVPLVRRLGEALQENTAGEYAAWWVTFDPFLIYFCRFFLSETVFITLMLAGVVCWIQFQAQSSKGLAAGAGVSFGLAALCRNIFVPMVLFSMMVMAVRALIKKGPARVATGVFVVACAVCLGSWSAYVYRHTGTFQIAVPQKGWTTYEGLNPDFAHPEAIHEWQLTMSREAEAQGVSGDPVKNDAYFWQKSKDWIRNHPGDFVWLMVRKTLKFWRIMPYHDYYSPAQAAVSALFFGPLLILALIGGGRVVRKGIFTTRGTGFIIIFILIYALMNTITWTQIRYRVSLHPLLALLAGIGIDRLRQRKERREWS